MLARLLFFIGIVCCLTACSIHPIPKDVTGLSTAMIVRKIRCEARDAVISKALVYLEYKKLQLNPEELRTLNVEKSHLPPEVKSYFAYFGQTGIVFSFALQGTENNNVSFSSLVSKPISNGTESLGSSFGDTLQRDNIRAFTITNNFQELVQLPADYCNFEPSSPNFQYPIAGAIGIAEMVDTFVDLTLFNNLGGEKDVATAAKRGPPSMGDTITFTTTISAGLVPKVVFTPVGTAARLLNATLILDASRIDKHKVIIGLGLPGGPDKIFGGRMAATGKSAAQRAVEEQILRFEVTKPLVVSP